jgi:phage terminase large subunit-like protein
MKRPCFIGVDLSLSDDLTAWCAAFPRLPGETASDWPRIYCVHRYYLPEECLYEREQEARVPLRMWVDGGHITLTEGDVIDHSQIRRDIIEFSEAHDIRSVAFDPAFGTETMVLLESARLPVVKFAQTRNTMSAALKEATELVMRGDLQHEGNPVTRWHVGNTQVQTDAGGRIYPIKSEGSGARKGKRRHKIDGVFAMLMATHCAMQEEIKLSVYEMDVENVFL